VAGVPGAWGTLRGIAASASFAILVYYGVANLAALRMPRARPPLSLGAAPRAAARCAVLALSLVARHGGGGGGDAGRGVRRARVVRGSPGAGRG
jgi:hypothetical protein